MQVRCQLCGSTADMPKWHQDYEKVRSGRPVAFICPACQHRVQAEARRSTQGQ
jgi:uncharacterized protein YlaI